MIRAARMIEPAASLLLPARESAFDEQAAMLTPPIRGGKWPVSSAGRRPVLDHRVTGDETALSPGLNVGVGDVR